MRKNLFIALEGIDGSGKSTQARLLSSRLKKEGHQVHTTFEPTDGPIGKMIRDIFGHKMEADHRTIAALFLADRLDHLLNNTTGMLKYLDEGYTVITDRYYLSSYAYHGTHMDMNWVIDANSLCADLLRPDLNIYIDVSIETSMSRLGKRKADKELYETEENLRNVQKEYKKAMELVKGKEHIYTTDGNRPQELIAADIWKEVSTAIATRK